MTLRRKSLVAVMGTTLALVAALYVAGRRIILDTALELERETVVLDLSRAVGALENRTAHLWSIAGDWATWDESYEFVRDRSPAFAAENLTPAALGNLEVTAVLFLDTDGKVVAERYVAPGSAAAAGLQHAFAALVAGDPRLVAAHSAGARGVLSLPEGAALVAARPIVRSDGGGEPRGTLVFARMIDVGAVASEARVANLGARLLPLTDPAVPPALRLAPAQPGASPPFAVVPLSFRTVRGFTLVEGLAGSPALALEVTGLRAIYVQGVRSLGYFMGALGVTALCFGLLVALLLERLVLSRVSRLSAGVHGIGGATDLSRRVAVDGGDELAALAAEVNAMLARLEEAHAALRRSRDELEGRVRERTAELEAANAALRAEIRERTRAEDALRALKEELERQNRDLRAVDRMKDALIGDVSHELRTPVAKQAMQLELLRAALERRGLAGEFAVQIRVMDAALRRQQSVIGNILTLSRLEAGGRGLRLGPVRLDELLAEVLEDYREQLADCGIEVALAAPPLTLRSDRELLWHVFSNLVSNAVKYRGQDAPRVEVGAAAVDGRVRVRVADNGTGFSAETRERLFERFYQGSASVEGIGLGLHIVRTILERIGGEVTIDSPGRGRGTVAEVVLPLEADPGG